MSRIITQNTDRNTVYLCHKHHGKGENLPLSCFNSNMSPDTVFKDDSPTLFRHGISVTNFFAKEDPRIRSFSGMDYAFA